MRPSSISIFKRTVDPEIKIMSKPELITVIIMGIMFCLVFIFFTIVMVAVNKKSNQMDRGKGIDKSINLMLLCLNFAAWCKSFFFPSIN